MAKHLPPEGRVLSRKESLEKGSRGWEGSHEDAKGACQQTVWEFAWWTTREGGGKLTPFLNIQYGILRYRAAQLQSGQGLTNANGLFSQILNRYHFSFWLVTTIISCQENMEKCCFESIQSDF